MTDAYQTYKEEVLQIIARVSSLEGRFPLMAGAPKEMRFLSDTEYWIRQTLAGNWRGAGLGRWDHKSGPRLTVPNPDYNPNIPFTAVAPMREEMGPGALEVTLFFEIETQRNPMRGGLVIPIGAMNVYVLVSAFEASLQNEIRQAIQEILEEEQKTFQAPQ